MSFSILVCVDGSDASTRAARHVARLAQHIGELEVHLLNVQPLGEDWTVRRSLKPHELDELEREWSEAAFEPARASLVASGVRFVEHSERGEAAATIVRCANEWDCDQIVMGSHGRSALGDLLLGSVASKVLHLAKLPVTLVK